MKKFIFPAVFLTMLILSVFAYAKDASDNLKDSLVRLHIIAESDSDYDQSIKLAVRDEVLSSVKNVDPENTAAFTAHAEAAANEYLETNNIPYRAHAEYGLFDFPVKQYMNITLPAGRYYGVRIILGSGSGQNWWCVMYPPLCVNGNNAYADDKAETELKKHLRDDTYDIITSDASKKQVRFRIVDFINSLR
ncbi:MAG: stage II sporulation protein R [Oscillospiraceae bacterium]|nr:stage II sporulation protein R [Oscillospiraceae bacterium]